MDCHYQAQIVLAPTEKAADDKIVLKMLEKNPFMTKEAISRYFEKSLKHYLDDEFEEYCIEDDYYQPVCEEFDIDDHLSDWCEKYGFELIDWDGDGGDDGYEPKFRRSW